MARITFVYPDFENIGIGYLMALCIEQGHEVDFVYYQAQDQYLERKIKMVPYDQIAQRIVNTQPDVVAFSCVTDNYQFQLQCAKALKKTAPSTITVFGGIHVTSKKINEEVLYRKSNNEKISEAINNLKDAKIMVQVDHMLGLPDDSIKTEKEGILFYNENRPDVISVFWLTYFPGLEIVNIAKERGILSDKDMDTLA